MAQDNTIRPLRANDPSRGAAQPSGAGGEANDPLVELARLIGQTDPFSGAGRVKTRADARGPEEAEPQVPPATSEWRKPALAEPNFTHREPGFARHDPYRMASSVGGPLDPQADAGPAFHRREPQLTGAQSTRPELNHLMPAAPANDLRAVPPYFDDGVPMTPRDEKVYDDPPPARRRGGIVTALMLIVFAMIGTAGAYSYRTYYATPSVGKAPPVITADTTPSKIVPAGDNQAGKTMQERVRQPARSEQIVSREEQPVELRDQPAASSPRVVLPAPVQPSRSAPPAANVTPPGSAAKAIPTPTAAPAGGVNEPKRVRTVTIKPDGADPSGRPVGEGDDSAMASAPGRGAPAAKSAPVGRNSGPLSLDPRTSATPQPAPASRARTAAVPPVASQSPTAQAPQAAAPPRGAGGYLVQLSSQRSEGEAQASFRSLQAKFPNQLGGQSAIIKRVDLGDRGIYYRAMVGPFASPAEAGQFCTDFKAAGGQCLIQRN